MSVLAKDNQDSQKALSKIVAKTWLDEEFNSKFLSNTNVVLEENGLSLPSDVDFKVQENTLVGIQKNSADTSSSAVVYEIPLPCKPAGVMDQQIQSWLKEDGTESTVSSCLDGGCF